MAKYNNRYQYETSPRKLQPEYVPEKKKQQKKNTNTKSTAKKSNEATKKVVKKNNNSKIILYISAIFIILFAVSYRNAMITQKYSEIKKLKTSLSEIEKNNKQIEVNIESKTNLGAIEEKASKELGLKKLDDSQTVYVSLDKQDYVESSEEEIKLEKDNLISNIINKIKNIF